MPNSMKTMYSIKPIFYCIALLNCYASVFYSNFLFFYMKGHFGFGDLENLLLAAFNGMVYAFSSWKCGGFAQRFGYARSIYIGCIGFASAMVAGLLLHTVAAQIIVFGVWTISVCFIWPALEAIICEGSETKISDRVGTYNLIWAGGSATAYFTTGMILERFGMQSLFRIPLCLVAVETVVLSTVIFIFRKRKFSPAVATATVMTSRPPMSKRFMHMAFLANPLSYVAINTVLPLIPSISSTMGLSTAAAGIVCSIWMFARLGTFALLWRWTGWHYRFRWLAGAMLGLLVSFTVLILARSIPLMLAAQIGFGASVGLIYYSSLYYSMNASEKRGANGGLHEAMIGTGLFLGPLCGAGAIVLLPASNAGTWSVSGLLAAGLSALLWMGRFRMKR
jgi:MFS family permease